MDFKNAIYKNNNAISNTLPEYVGITYEQLQKILFAKKSYNLKPSPKLNGDISKIDEFINENESIFYDFYNKGLEKWRDKGFLNILNYTSFCDLIAKNIIINLKDNLVEDESEDETTNNL